MNAKMVNRPPDNDPTARIGELSEVEQDVLSSVSFFSQGDIPEKLLAGTWTSPDAEGRDFGGFEILRDKLLSLGVILRVDDQTLHVPEKTYEWATKHVDE